MDDYRAIDRTVDVELDRVGPQLDCAQECGDRVLGERLVRTPVGNLLGQPSAVTRTQAFLEVITLGTMSAKL